MTDGRSAAARGEMQRLKGSWVNSNWFGRREVHRPGKEMSWDEWDACFKAGAIFCQDDFAPFIYITHMSSGCMKLMILPDADWGYWESQWLKLHAQGVVLPGCANKNEFDRW